MTKNARIEAGASVARTAIFLLSFSSNLLVTAMETGIVPIGSMTAKKSMNFAM
jgi:hypothetical protein